MTRTFKTVVAGVAALATLIVGLLALLVGALLVYEPLRVALAERAAQAALGREVEIGGLSLPELGTTTTVEVTDLRIANPDWTEEPNLLRAPRVRAVVALTGLFPPAVAVRDVAAEEPAIHLMVAEDGRTSWGGLLSGGQPGGSGQGGGTDLLGLRQLRIAKGAVTYRDAGAGRDLRLRDIDATAPAADQPIAFDARGRVGGASGPEFRIEGQAGSLDDLRNGALPIDATLHAGAATVAVDGRIAEPFGSRRVDARITVEGDDLRTLMALAGVAVESTPAVRAEAHVVGQAPRWQAEDLQARVAGIAFNGSAALDVSGARPALRANLSVPSLPWPVGEAAATAPSGAQDGGSARIIPDTPIPAAALTGVDAEVTVTVDEVAGAPVPLGGGRMDATLRDGVLRLDPLRVEVAGGAVRADATVDANPAAPTVTAAIRIDRIAVGELMTAVDVSRRVSGRINGTMDLRSEGGTLQAMSENLNGSVDLHMDEGRFTTRMIDALAVNAREALGFLFSGGAVRPVDCFVGRLTIEDGTVSPDALAFVTNDMVVRGQGTVDLGAERFHLDLIPRPKRRHLLDLTVPVHVRGPLADPQVEVGVSLITELARSGVCKRLMEEEP